MHHSHQGSSLGLFPTSHSPDTHFNQPSAHWHCVKSCLVGSSNKYQLQDLKRRTSTMTPAAFNITQTCLKFLTIVLWWKPHDPRITNPPTFHFFKADVSPTNTNIGTFYFSIFTTIQYTSNFRKLTHSHLYNYEHFLLNFTDILIFTITIVWTFCFLFVNIIVKFFTCLLVWFATLCFVLSLQPYVFMRECCL